MTLIALIMYAFANAVAFLLYWLYQVSASQKSDTDIQTDNVKRKRLKRKPSLFTMIGLDLEIHKHYYAIDDHFRTFSEVSEACKRAGLEHCGLIIGVDFTASNEWQGRKSFSGNCLHKVVPGRIYNPYQKVISVIAQTLEPFDDDNYIPAFGFGDTKTLGDSVFPFMSDGSPCKGFAEVLDRYSDIATKVTFSGPTNFAPLIYKAIEIVKTTQKYHILIIVADGQVNEEQQTVEAIVEASNHPLSIVVVGVGDGPWDTMDEFDDCLPNRKFDNFQFVDYHAVTSKVKHPDANFALHALMEIPLQYKTIRKLGYISEFTNGSVISKKESDV